MFAVYRKAVNWVGTTMRLECREVLEHRGGIGVKELCDLKKACREFEAYWDCVRYRY